ncbi:MAG: NAD(+)/NADH kinase [Solirubrobacterales bacterium]
MSAPTAFLFTHSHAEGIERATEVCQAAAERHGWNLVASEDRGTLQPELCIVLGGDGMMLSALRTTTGTKTPVFGINFGRVGFLAAVEADQIELGLDRAFAGDTETIDLPGLDVTMGDQKSVALNDVSFSRRPRGGVAELSYRIAGEEVGHVRCDGLVAATSTGSTGYNLANNGPILAWGVDGYVVSYIAPHTLTARALVVAPGDVLHVTNHRSRDGVDTAVDGAQVGELSPGAEAEVRYRRDVARIAQLPGSNFYHRIREKFGHLAV